MDLLNRSTGEPATAAAKPRRTQGLGLLVLDAGDASRARSLFSAALRAELRGRPSDLRAASAAPGSSWDTPTPHTAATRRPPRRQYEQAAADLAQAGRSGCRSGRARRASRARCRVRASERRRIAVHHGAASTRGADRTASRVAPARRARGIAAARGRARRSSPRAASGRRRHRALQSDAGHRRAAGSVCLRTSPTPTCSSRYWSSHAGGRRRLRGQRAFARPRDAGAAGAGA